MNSDKGFIKKFPVGTYRLPLSFSYVSNHKPHPTDKTYRSKDIQAIAEVSKMQLVHWTHTKAILPLQDAKGRGGRRVYSYQNLLEALICRELNKFSIQTQVMRDVLNVLRERTWQFVFDIKPDSTESTSENRGSSIEPDRLGGILGVESETKLPILIERECTLWECLRLCGGELQGFYQLIIGKNDDFKPMLAGTDNISEVLAEYPSAFVIDLWNVMGKIILTL